MKSYKHFTLVERKSLYPLRKEEKGIRAIARKRRKRAPSTISREIKRNVDRDGKYNVKSA